MSEPIWYKDPAVLFTATTWSKFVPTNDMTVQEALNSVVRFTTYFSVLLFAATGVSTYVLAIPIVMAITVILNTYFPNVKVLESFTSKVGGGKVYTMPSAENPFMNPLLTEILDNPDRGDSAPTSRKDVKQAIASSFSKTSDLYMDTSDVFDQSQAMRTFHTIQAGTIPSDQGEFLKFLGKGLDEPDFSSAPPARHGKILNEGYVPAKGSMASLPSTTSSPVGTTPSGPAPSTGKKA